MKKILFAIWIVLVSGQLMAQSSLKVLNSYPIKSLGGWDYIAVHEPTQRIYVSHTSQVNILNAVTGDSIGVIAGTTGVHGITFADEFNKGFTSNGKLNNAFVFDLKTNTKTAEIKTGENPDAIFYDAFSKKVYTCNGKSKDVTVINPADNSVVATIPVGGKPETAVSDNAGNIYVNIEDKSEIVVIDTKTFTVTKHWSIAPGEEPTGLAIDTKVKKLFAGCGNKKLVIVNYTNGRVENTLTIGDGCDGVAYDSKLKQVYASNGQDGTMTVITGNAAGEYKVTGTVPTKKSARTLTVDETTHKVYLPAAETEPNSEPGKRAKLIPGTFQILVVGDK
jgi:YVTN family beta-propeller protein